ncbi:MAG: alkaline phosphatase family protein, partial [Candidatus Scalindua sp.]
GAKSAQPSRLSRNDGYDGGARGGESEGVQMTKISAKTVVIGLDGATWRVLDPLMERGMMPNLKRIIQGSAKGTLKSTIPPVTGPAWVSFATGKNPGKHGCFDFTYPTNSLVQLKTISSNRIRAKTFYEYLSENGKKTIFVNLPGSYPPRTNDITITSLFTKGDQFIFPSDLVAEIPELQHYRLTPDMNLIMHNKTRDYINDIRQIEKNRFVCVKALFEKNWDLFFVLFSGSDWIQHVVYDKLVSGSLPNDHAAIAFYQELDNYLEWFLDNIDGNVNLLIISDHGFDTYQGTFYLNEWLRREGYLKVKAQPRTVVRQHRIDEEIGKARDNRFKIIKIPLFVKGFLQGSEVLNTLSTTLYRWLRDKLSLKLEVDMCVDLANSAAYCTTNELNGIYINCKNRYSNGVVSTENYERLRSEIIEKLRKLADKNGKKLFKNVFPKEEIYEGEMILEGPDIVIELDGYITGANFPMKILEYEEVIYHHADGIFLATGPVFEKGKQIAEASLLDIAPTILYIMGMNVPEDMDGRVLFSAIKDDFVENNPVQFLQQPEPLPFSGNEPLDDCNDDELVIERLKGLGYMG